MFIAVINFFLLNLSTSIPIHGVTKINSIDDMVAIIANNFGCPTSLLIYQGMMYIPILTAIEEKKLDVISKVKQVFCE